MITLNRPDDLNASTTDMLFAYPKLFRALPQDSEARVAILTGAGRAFSAGGDFQHFVKTLEDSDFARAVQENARRTILSFTDLTIPFIAAVNGPAVGWGATMATLCDIVLMSEKSFMAEPHINIGLVGRRNFGGLAAVHQPVKSQGIDLYRRSHHLTASRGIRAGQSRGSAG